MCREGRQLGKPALQIRNGPSVGLQALPNCLCALAVYGHGYKVLPVVQSRIPAVVITRYMKTAPSSAGVAGVDGSASEADVWRLGMGCYGMAGAYWQHHQWAVGKKEKIETA
jgi:hypothetical protein